MNWSKYNECLKNRGKLSLYFPKGDIKSQFINEMPYIKGISGQCETYKQPYIEFIYTFYVLFGWGMRQICGYLEDTWKTQGLNITVPSFGHLFETVSLKTKQHCKTLKKCLANGESVDVIVDSTGLKFNNALEWYLKKYGLSS